MLTHLRGLLFDPVYDVFAVDSPDGDEVGDGVLLPPVLLAAVGRPVGATAPAAVAVAGDRPRPAPAGPGTSTW